MPFRQLRAANAPQGTGTPDLGYAFVEALREIAERGLTAPKGREFARQRRIFIDRFTSAGRVVRPPAPAAPADAGAFFVTRDPDGSIVAHTNPRSEKAATDPQTAFLGQLSKSERLVVQLYTRAFQRRPAEQTDRIRLHAAAPDVV